MRERAEPWTSNSPYARSAQVIVVVRMLDRPAVRRDDEERQAYSHDPEGNQDALLPDSDGSACHDVTSKSVGVERKGPRILGRECGMTKRT